MFYVANALLRSSHSPPIPEEKTLWEELFILVEAESEDQALSLAQDIGRRSAVAYKNVAGETVQWSFVEVTKIHLLDRLVHGTELFARFLRNTEAMSLRQPFDDEA